MRSNDINDTSTPDLSYVISMLSQYRPLSDALQKEFYKHAFQLNLKPGDHVLHQGGYCKAMYFIKSGAMIAYTDSGHKRVTTYISVEGDFFSSLSGLYGEEPSREAIMAIEPTLLFGVHTDILLQWYERFFELNFIIRKVYEAYYRDAQERNYIIRLGDAKARYNYFSKTRPEAAKRLAVEHLAAFLDMKPATLLRIKKENLAALSSEEMTNIMKKTEDFVLHQEAFKEKSLKVSSLAKSLSIPEYKIAKAIKLHHKMSFRDYLNKHRVENFKRWMGSDGMLDNFTIESLATQSGFASRSGFYKAFKKLEGLSPKEFFARV